MAMSSYAERSVEVVSSDPVQRYTCPLRRQASRIILAYALRRMVRDGSIVRRRTLRQAEVKRAALEFLSDLAQSPSGLPDPDHIAPDRHLYADHIVLCNGAKEWLDQFPYRFVAEVVDKAAADAARQRVASDCLDDERVLGAIMEIARGWRRRLARTSTH